MSIDLSSTYRQSPDKSEKENQQQYVEVLPSQSNQYDMFERIDTDPMEIMNDFRVYSKKDESI